MFEFSSTAAALIVMIVGTGALVINTVVGAAVRRSAAFGYAFGNLCFSQVIANIGMSATFVVLSSGITFVHPSWHATYLGRRSGQLLIFFWEGSLFTHLFAAINRATVISFPITYNRFFGRPIVTKIIVVIIWSIATVQSLPYFIPTCSMIFDPISFTYDYGEGLCGEITKHYTDCVVSITVVGLIGILDATSFLRFLKLKGLRRNTSEIRPREVRFFFQACAQSSVLLSSLVFFFFLVNLNLENSWYLFATTTLVWVLVPTLDGIIVIVFNKEVRNMIQSKWRNHRVDQPQGSQGAHNLTATAGE